MKSTYPLISVILPVYNAAPYIEESIRSILNQSYTNFEFIIINDGSKDNSAELIENIKDPRIRFYSQDNIGLANTLNKGIGLAKGDFIARQDADDISLSQRFEKQIQFLIANPNVMLLGTWAEIIPVQNNTPRFHKHSAHDIQLKVDLLFDNPFVHTSVMFRKSCIDIAGNYNPKKLMEDYDLWSRIAQKYNIANIPEVLVKYREVTTGLSKIDTDIYKENVISQNIENIHYFHSENIQTVPLLCNIYHTRITTLNRKVSLRSMIAVLNDLTRKIAISNKNDSRSVGLAMKPHLKRLISKYYDIKKQEAGVNFLLLFWLKIICRIRFTLQF